LAGLEASFFLGQTTSDPETLRLTGRGRTALRRNWTLTADLLGQRLPRPQRPLTLLVAEVERKGAVGISQRLRQWQQAATLELSSLWSCVGGTGRISVTESDRLVETFALDWTAVA
jgi:hypothetical protein